MRIRRAAPADILGIMSLERQAASGAHWPRQEYDRLFLSDPGSLSERRAWIAEDDPDPLAEEGKQQQPKLLAFLIARVTNDECELENVVVDVNARRKGVATLLLAQLLHHSQEFHVSSIFLEVRESNHAARRLYEKSGFEIVGLRKNYYSQPRENAVLYRRNLC